MALLPGLHLKEGSRFTWWRFFSVLGTAGTQSVCHTEELREQIVNFPPFSLNSIAPSGRKRRVTAIHTISPVDTQSCLIGASSLPQWAGTEQGDSSVQLANCLSL